MNYEYNLITNIIVLIATNPKFDVPKELPESSSPACNCDNTTSAPTTTIEPTTTMTTTKAPTTTNSGGII